MAISKFILDIGKKIEDKSGAKINFRQRSRARCPTEEWIAEREILKEKVICLRTAEETKQESVAKLRQFNPSALLKDAGEIHCRIPGCSSTTHRLKSYGSSEEIKEDLFLCDIHRATLTNAVSRRCARENVIVNRFKLEDFSGYTNLIGELDKAFTYLVKKSSFFSATNSPLAEVFLNTRNFLLITNALLNPDEDNTMTALAPYMSMFQSFLNFVADSEILLKLTTALRDIINMVLLSFGVIYSWVFLANPGARVGAGVGILFGFVGALAYTFSPAGVFVSAMVCLIAGSLIGGGGYDWYKDHQYMKKQQQMIQEHQKLMYDMFGCAERSHVTLIPAHGNAAGDLAIQPPKRE